MKKQIEVEVKKLEGFINFKIKIKPNDPLIIYGLNGCGKTTALKYINMILSEPLKIINHKFDYIKVKYGKEINVHKKLYNNNVVTIKKESDKKIFEIYEEEYETFKDKNRYGRKTRVEETLKSDYLKEILSKENLELLSFKTIYLPVSRILETKSIDLNVHEDEFIDSEIDPYRRRRNSERKNEFIDMINENFSYRVIEKLFKREKNDIYESLAVESEMLIRDFLDPKNDILDSEINEKTRKTFAWLVDTKKIEEGNIDSYSEQKINFINLLTKNFDNGFKKQSKLSDLINSCNSFLSNKMLVDSHSEGIQLFENDNKIPMNSFSSGELHILLILSKIYTNKNKENIIIIDEPELSLNYQWQEKIIESILKLHNVSSFICATHSPFILGDKKQYEENIYELKNEKNK